MKKLKQLLFLFLLLYNHYALSQNNMVDLFTGDFTYNIPAMVVPSSNGPGVALNLNYRAPIQMHQKASWVGLGWDLNIGEIRRNLKGIPDEWNGKNVTVRTYKKNASGNLELNPTANPSIGEKNETNYWGALHFKDFVNGTNNAMDTYIATSPAGKSFVYPDYDQFIVTGPGISGIMQAFLFDKGSLVHKDGKTLAIDSPNKELSMDSGFSNHPFSATPGNPIDASCQEFTKEAQFRFINEFGSIDVPAPFNNNQTSLSFDESFQGNQTYSGLQLSGKARNARHIVYYRNSDLVSSLPAGFIDYNQSGFNRLSNDDIGAFSITNEAGFTFHYSLPVYMLTEKNIAITMEGFDINNVEGVTTSSKTPYVSSWKLTAITGPDFKDFPPFNEVGPEDQGYWVAFSYGLWHNTFEWQGPFYEGHRHFGENTEHYEQISEYHKVL